MAKGNSKVIDLFHHEFGHILEYRQWFVGLDGFYKVIAPESIATSALRSSDFANYLSQDYLEHHLLLLINILLQVYLIIIYRNFLCKRHLIF